MALGEYESTVAAYSLIPTNVPRPIAVGTYASDAKKHFFLAEFRDMLDELPPISELVSVITQLHQRSMSPNGKFGFHVTTYQGNQPLNNSWCDTWEEYFTREMRDIIKIESAIQGQDAELDDLAEKLITQVIPRLLRPLETGGRKIKPTLVHGDLWHGNVGVDIATDEPVLYDVCAFYAHNECRSGHRRLL